MANTKTTKKQYFEMIMAIEGISDEIREFCSHEIELLAKKSGSRKQSKGQIENENIKAEILELLADNVPRTCTEIRVALDDKYTQNKVVALMTQLAGSVDPAKRDPSKVYPVVREVDGKRITFRLAEAEVEDGDAPTEEAEA